MTEAELFRVRVGLVQTYLRENKYDGILLSRPDNFAMATGGKRNYVYMFSEAGVCSLFITKTGKTYLVSNTIESGRIMDEELADLGCGVREFLWFEDAPANIVQREFTGNFVSDDGSLGPNVNGELAYLRSLLTVDELEKYRRLGKLAAEAMTGTIQSITPGMAEADIAARLVAEGVKRRCMVPVALVAADQRIAKHRHPLPTEGWLLQGASNEARVKNCVMVVGCFLKEGLVASITRFKKTGDVPKEIEDRYARICGVDALMQEATQPGKTLGDVFAVCQQAYKDLGFPENEWHNHHQGGAAGYAGRTCKGAPGETFPILDPVWPRKLLDTVGMDVDFGQAFAWNPSGVGVKSEDTFILLPNGAREIVTQTPAFPKVELETVLGRKTEAIKSGLMP